MMVWGFIASGVRRAALHTSTTTATITDRRDVFADGRVALDQISKQLRQGESIDQAASTASSITFSSYINGTPETIIWRVSGTAAPYSLEQSRDDGGHFAPVVSSLTNNTPFTYTSHGGIVGQVALSHA